MFNSPLKNAKGLGSAHNGVHHWWLQRLTAILLVPLVIWFTFQALGILSLEENIAKILVLDSAYSVAVFALLLLAALYHGTLGVKVIIEDYVSCKCGKAFLIIFTTLFGSFTAILLVFALIKLFVSI